MMCFASPEIVTALLDAGANVNAASARSCAFPMARGWATPSDVARGVGFDELVEELGARGGTAFEHLHAYAGPQGRV